METRKRSRLILGRLERDGHGALLELEIVHHGGELVAVGRSVTHRLLEPRPVHLGGEPIAQQREQRLDLLRINSGGKMAGGESGANVCVRV